MSKKILQVVSCLEYGGTEAYIMNNYRNLDKSKFKFDFLVFQEKEYPYIEEIKKLGGDIYYCGLPEAKNLGKFIKNIISCIKKNGPYDAIHTHVNIANAWVLFAAWLAGVKIRISHSHDTSGRESSNILKKIYYKLEEIIIKNLATHKLACSIEAGNYLYGEKYFKKNGIFSNNGINIKRFMECDQSKVQQLKNSINIKSNDFVIMNITRFEPKKNPEFTVDVFYEILKEIPNAILVLGGVDGGQLEYIKEKVRRLGISNNVRFIGVRKDINVCLNLCDIYIFPSLFEGLPIALLEIQASKTKSIVSSNVSKQVDIGLGLIDFLDLKKGAKYWANYIITNMNYKKPTNKIVKDKFKESNFTIQQSVNQVAKIYLGER